jgi:hypothetical protein
MKHIKPRWIVIGVIVLALAAGVWRSLSNKRAQQAAASAPASTVTQVELTTSDVLKAELRDITQGLEISGTVKAVNYAVIKARVAGELKEGAAREGDAVKAAKYSPASTPLNTNAVGSKPPSKPNLPKRKWKLPDASGTTTNLWWSKVSFLKRPWITLWQVI